MFKEIFLNDTLIKVDNYIEENESGLHKIIIEFKVSSEEYHAISVLLYEGTFDVQVPERDLTFRGMIQNYSTSITNLYEKGNVGDYKLSLVEVKN